MTTKPTTEEHPVTFQPASLKILADGAQYGLRKIVWHYTTKHRQDQVRHERYFFGYEKIRPGDFIIVRSSPVDKEASTAVLIIGERDYLDGYMNVYYLVPPTADRDLNGRPPAVVTSPPSTRAA